MSWKMEKTAGTMRNSVNENRVIQDSGNFIEMDVMTYCD